MAYFTDENGNDINNLENVIFTKKIDKIEENLDGKKNHVGIFVGEQRIHLKIEKDKERKAWLKYIRYFNEFYKEENSHSEKKIEEEVDLETTIRIGAEIETSKWT